MGTINTLAGAPTPPPELPPWATTFGPPSQPGLPIAAPKPPPKPVAKLGQTAPAGNEVPGPGQPLPTDLLAPPPEIDFSPEQAAAVQPWEPPPIDFSPEEAAAVPTAETAPNWAAPTDDPWAAHSTGHVSPAITDYLGNPFNATTPEATTDALAALSKSDPERFAQVVGAHQADVERQARAQQVADEHALMKQRETDLAVNNARVMAAHKAMTDVANTPTVNAWGDASFGTKAAGYLTAALGGLMQGYALTKGIQMANPGIAAIQQLQDNAITAQRAELGRKTNALSALISTYGDEFKAEQALRVAQYNEVVSNTDQYLTQVDPRGTQAMRALQFRQGIIAARDQAIQAAGDHAAKQAETAAKIQLTEAQTEGEKAKAAGEWNKLLPKPAAGGNAGTDVAPGGTYTSLAAIPEKERKLSFPIIQNGKIVGYGLAVDSTSAEKARTATHAYGQLQDALNEMQKLAIARDNAQSLGGATWDNWKTTEERNYDRQASKVANIYALMMHGAAPTQSQLEEVHKDVVPRLTSAIGRGNTASLINTFRNDLDRDYQMQMQLGGATSTSIKSERPAVDTKTPHDYIRIVASPPLLNKDGSARPPAVSGDELVQSLESAYDLHKAGGMSDEDWKKQLDYAEFGVRSNAAQLKRIQEAAEKKALGGKPKPAGLDMTDIPEVANAAAALEAQEKVLNRIHVMQRGPVVKPKQPTTQATGAKTGANALGGAALKLEGF